MQSCPDIVKCKQHVKHRSGWSGDGTETVTRPQFVRKFIRYEQTASGAAGRRSARVEMMDQYGSASAPPAFANIVAPKVCDVQLELDFSHRRTLQSPADAAAVPVAQLRTLLADILPEWPTAAIDNVFFSAVQPRKAGPGAAVVDYKQALLPHVQSGEGVESAAVARASILRSGMLGGSGVAPALVRLSAAEHELVSHQIR